MSHKGRIKFNSSNNLIKIWEEKRRILGLTQAQAGQILGITVSAVNQYLHGRTNLGTDAVLKFAQLLGVNPEDIDPAIGSRLKILGPIFARSSDRCIPVSPDEIDFLIEMRRCRLPSELRTRILKMAESIG